MSAEGLEFNERMQTDDLLRRRRALALPTDVIEEAGHLRLALRRLASLEAFTAPLDLTHPSRLSTDEVITELQARMLFAGEAADSYGDTEARMD